MGKPALDPHRLLELAADVTRAAIRADRTQSYVRAGTATTDALALAFASVLARTALFATYAGAVVEVEDLPDESVVGAAGWVLSTVRDPVTPHTPIALGRDLGRLAGAVADQAYNAGIEQTGLALGAAALLRRIEATEKT